MKNFRAILLFTALLSLASAMHAQKGYSSASVSMSRLDQIPTPDQIHIAEYINYHEHRLSTPAVGEPVALDLRWGNPHVGRNSREAILQIGLSTQDVSDYSELPPVNICLVIDKSGSMANYGKMDKLKKALREFVQGLRAKDRLAIVSYDARAWVSMSSRFANDRYAIHRAIDNLAPGGNTNLHGGMILGYEEVQKHMFENGANRVILLTDGIANTGVTDPATILRNSKAFNSKGIDITTIGFGDNVQHKLLRQIADAGNGSKHFVGNAQEDIQKVFRDELESLLAPAAKNPMLTVSFPSSLRIKEVLGYSPNIQGNRMNLQLENMNSGLTMVVLVRFAIEDISFESAQVNANISFNRPGGQPRWMKREKIYLDNKSYADTRLLIDPEVKKNYTIAEMGLAMKNMATAYQRRDMNGAIDILRSCMQEVDRRYTALQDKDIKRVYDILEDKYSILAEDMRLRNPVSREDSYNEPRYRRP